MNNFSPLVAFTVYWKHIFKQENPLDHIDFYNHPALEKLMKRMDLRHYPEPFYGLWDDHLQEDGVLLLINPGEVPFDNETVQGINRRVQNRFCSWTKEEFLAHDYNNRSNKYDLGTQWRLKRQRQAERLIDTSLRFLHIIEYFPFHSKNWTTLSHEEKQYISTLPNTKRTIDAIIDISQHKKAQFIIGIGEPWVDIFQRHGFDVQKKEIQKPKNRRFSHRIYSIHISNTSLPIIIYVSGAGGMSLPRDPEAVTIIRNFLKIKTLT